MKKIKTLLVATSFLSLAACQSKPAVEGEGKIGGTLTVVTSRTDADELYASIEEGFKAKYPEVEDIIWESSADYDSDIMKMFYLFHLQWLEHQVSMRTTSIHLEQLKN